MSGGGFQNELIFGINADFTGSDPPEDDNGLGTAGIDNEIWVGRALQNSTGSNVYVTRLLAAGGITLNFNRIDPFNPLNPSTLTITGPGITQDLHVARFIVSAGGAPDGANFTTLTNAYAAAVLVGGNQTVFLQPGTYVEDIVLEDGINICAFTCDAQTPNVTIHGKLTFTQPGSVSISGLNLRTNGDYCIVNGGVGDSIINVKDCNLVAVDNNTVQFTNTSANSEINFYNCTADKENVGLRYFAHSSNGTVNLKNCYFDNNSGDTTTFTLQSDGTFIIYNTFYAEPITSQGGSVLLTRKSTFLYTTIIDASTYTASECFLGGGAFEALTLVGLGSVAHVTNCTISSSLVTSAIGVAGTLSYSGLNFEDSSIILTSVGSNLIPLVRSNDAERIKSPAAYPYTVIGQDNFIIVNTTLARTINLPPVPSTGEHHEIKDATGTANVNNITIQGNGNNIDGAATKTISSPYGSSSFIYNGTEWNASDIGTGNDLHVARFIVSAGGIADGANYTTIATAITAAAAAGGKQTVFIQPGTYTENLLLVANVNLSAFECDARSASVIILGKLTANFVGTVGLSGLNLRTNGDYCIQATAGTATLSVFSCEIDAVNNNAINLATGGATFNFTACTFDIEAGGLATFTMTNGSMNWNHCINSNAASSTTDNTQSAGTLTLKFCQLQPGIVTSGTATLFIDACQLGRFNLPQNHTQLTCGGSGDHKVSQCYFLSGNQPAITVTSTLNITSSSIRSSNANAITGVGTITSSGISFEGSASAISTTTQVLTVGSNAAVQVTAPGAYPYTVVPQDFLVIVSTALARTINLPAAPSTGEQHLIKDNTGNAGTNTMTIQGNGNNIDGAVSTTITTNFGSKTFAYNGTQWNIV